MKNILFLAGFLIFITVSISGQNPDWEVLTSSKEIRGIAKEGRYLWLATRGGLVQFDKLTQTSFVFTKHNSGIPSIDVRCIAIDASGNKWVGTWGCGLAMYDGTNWIVYNKSNSQIASNYIKSLMIDRNQAVWVGQDRAVQKLFGSSWTLYNRVNAPFDFDANGLACDSSNNVFVATSFKGLLKFDGLNWTVYNFLHNYIGSVYVDPSNTVWTSYSNCNSPTVLVRIIGNTVIHDSISQWSTPIAQVGMFASDDIGNVWFTSLSGICRYDGNGFHLFNSTNSQVTTFPYPYAIAADSSFVWFGEFSGRGLKCFDKNVNVNSVGIVNDLLKGHTISSIAVDTTGNVWFDYGEQNGCISGCYNFLGIEKYNGSGIQSFTSANSGLPSDAITAIAIDPHNHVWLGAWGVGLIRFDGTNWTHFTPNLNNFPGDVVQGPNVIAFDSSGNTWVVFRNYSVSGIASPGGLAKYDGSTWTRIIPPFPNPNKNYDAVGVDRQGNVWVACNDKILKYDGSSWSMYNMAGLATGAFSVAFSPTNEAWFGSYQGLIRIDALGVSVFTSGNSGLPDNYINSLAFDDGGRLWMSISDLNTYEYGLSCFDGTGFINYSMYNSGLSTCNSRRVATWGNKVYLTTDEGLNSYSYNPLTGISLDSDPGIRGLIVYPNPSEHIAYFQMDEPISLEVQIFDLLGHLVRTTAIQQGAGVSGDLLPGIYLVRWINSNGAKCTKRFVITG